MAVQATSAAAKTVQTDLSKVQDDQQWISQNKGTASKQDIAAHTATAEKDWEKFSGDAAGLQQSSDPNDKQFALQSYSTAQSAFNSTQSDLKEVLGGRLNADLQSGDGVATDIQHNLSSLIDQGNASILHAQALVNQGGQASVYVPDPGSSAGPVAGGTASPNNVGQQSVQTLHSNLNLQNLAP